MEIEADSIEEIIAKIRDIDKLPTYSEAEQLLHFLKEKYQRDHSQGGWACFCEEEEVHNVYNVEFIDALAEEIKGLADSPIVEICAGDCRLSHQLRKRGVDIRATDDYSDGLSKNRNLVDKLSYKQALEKYNPRIVVASWIPHKTRIGFDVLDFPSVKYFIDIGEDVGGATWMTEEIYKREDFVRTFLEKVEKYSICRQDFPDGIYHSHVSLFSRVETAKRDTHLLK